MSHRHIHAGQSGKSIAEGAAIAARDEGPVPLRLAVLVLWVEAVVLVLLGLLAGAALVREGSAAPVLDAVIVALPFAVGFLLYQVGRWLTERRSAARGLGMMLQLLVLPIAFFLAATGEWLRIAVGVVIALVALGCLGLLVVPSSRVALEPLTPQGEEQ
jgi:hypothetical protein